MQAHCSAVVMRADGRANNLKVLRGCRLRIVPGHQLYQQLVRHICCTMRVSLTALYWHGEGPQTVRVILVMISLCTFLGLLNATGPPVCEFNACSTTPT